MVGTVIESTGLYYIIKNNVYETFKCCLKGKFRQKNIKFTNPLAVGDRVSFEINKDEKSGIINEILPRKNYISRKYGKKKHFQQILASNIDYAILINAPVKNTYDLEYIDKFLITSEFFNIPAIIVFNKIDLLEEENLKNLNYIVNTYKGLNYKVFKMSVIENLNINDLKKICINKISLLIGNSGVGKSSLINKISEKAFQKIGGVSKKNSRGRHTTSYSKMFSFHKNSFLIDSPGVQYIFPNEITKYNLHLYFPEFSKYSNCKYYNCVHIYETDCEVKQYVCKDIISKFRYKNYLKIFNILSKTIR